MGCQINIFYHTKKEKEKKLKGEGCHCDFFSLAGDFNKYGRKDQQKSAFYFSP
jgi:hypothetical protein